MGLGKQLKDKAMQLSQQAMERLFADEARAQKIADAMGTMQRGKEAFDSTQRMVLNQLNFATKADFKDLGKKISSLKKRLKSLDDKLKKI
jgi:polyhydroxyalkanoate synthesis regulator phasin